MVLVTTWFVAQCKEKKQNKPNNFSFGLFQVHSLNICNIFDMRYFLRYVNLKICVFLHLWFFLWLGRNSFSVLLKCVIKPEAYNVMKYTILFSSWQHYFMPMKQYFFSTVSFLKLRLSVNTEVFLKCSVLFKIGQSESNVKSFTPQKGQ